MLRLYVLALSLFALPAFGSAFNHMSGTSMPSGFTGVAASNGVSCMNGTIVSGSGGTCTGAVSGETWLNQVTAANADVALVYRTVEVPLTTSRIYWFYLRSSTTGATTIYLNEGVPVAGTNTAVFGTTGKALMRLSIGQNSGVNVGIDRYDTLRARTQWNSSTNTWAAPTVNASTTLAASYQLVGLEIDGPGRRWRAHVIGQTGTANTPSASLFQPALSDWTLFSFHEGGVIFCNPTCGSVYLAIGDPLNDATTITSFIEVYAEDDGTAVDSWLNGRDAGGSWDIYHAYAYPDANGVPGRFLPEDRTTLAVANGGGGAWDEVHVKDPYVLKDGATYYMMYGGANAAGKFQVGCATASAVGGAWTKCPNNPLVALSAGTDHDQTLNPVLVKDEAEPDSAKRWKLIYVGADTSSPIRFRAFVRTCSAAPSAAACDTAAEWSAATLIADVGGVGAIDEIGWGRVLPVASGGTNYLFGGVRALSGGAALNRQETYGTTSDRWLSAISKSGTITNPSLSSDCSTTTTAAITTPGSRSFTVASTTGCVADQMVVVDDDATSGNYHVNRIQNVVNATTLTMYHVEDALASGGRVRAPNAFNQIDVGLVGSYAGGLYKIATCFDPMLGGGSSFDAYAEQACVWTGAAITGPWTLYGLASAPLNSFGRAASWENMSLVNTPFLVQASSGNVVGFPQGAFP